MTTHIPGELEIDHNRGVIYFHATTEQDVKEFGTQTILRICNLPKGLGVGAIDITHMKGMMFIPPPERKTSERRTVQKVSTTKTKQHSRTKRRGVPAERLARK